MRSIRVTFNDETTQDFHLNIADALQWERAHDRSAVELEGDKPRFSDWLWMCWRQVKKENTNTKPFEMWIETVSDFDWIRNEKKDN